MESRTVFQAEIQAKTFSIELGPWRTASAPAASWGSWRSPASTRGCTSSSRSSCSSAATSSWNVKEKTRLNSGSDLTRQSSCYLWGKFKSVTNGQTGSHKSQNLSHLITPRHICWKSGKRPKNNKKASPRIGNLGFSLRMLDCVKPPHATSSKLIWTSLYSLGEVFHGGLVDVELRGPAGRGGRAVWAHEGDGHDEGDRERGEPGAQFNSFVEISTDFSTDFSAEFL